VTTVPAAAFASVALIEGRYAQAGQSALQLVVNLAGIVVVAAVVVLVVSRPAAAGHEGCAHSLPGSRRWRHGDGHGLLCTVRRDTAVNRGWRGRVLTRREHRPRVGRRVEEHQYIVARAQCGVRAYPQR
jgi:hypothetical protein